MTPHTLIYNSRYDEFQIIRPDMKWTIGMPGDKVIREDTYDGLVFWFNGLSQDERYKLAHGNKKDPEQLSLAA